jgi:hydroxymethylpyrimidine/phosphomethylpyrimidine kinase
VTAAGRATRPRLLTIAGSDSGGGAGIQADLKTFAAHGGYGMSVVTAVTAQNTVRVTRVHPIPPEVVAAQIDAVFDDLGVDAVKIGMLADAGVVGAVAGRLAARLPEAGHPPVVLDPVMVAKSGDPLLADDAVEALLEELLPLATLVTPNLPEAARMTGIDPPRHDEAARLSMAEALARRAGGAAVLVKGGHGTGDVVADLLLAGGRPHWSRRPRLDTVADHGTGCTLSSAIAARLAVGEPLAAAVEGAIDYLRGAMAAARPLGAGHGPVDHLYRLAPAAAGDPSPLPAPGAAR